MATTKDELFGTEMADTLRGGDGDDTIHGEEGNDLLEGGSGDDRLFGNDGDDTLDGGADDDWLYGGPGADVLNGGDGDDDFVGYWDSDAGVSVDLSTGEASGGSAEGDTFSGIEHISGSRHDDTLVVADGKHRSAAAAMLDREHFLCVCFPLEGMSLAPYNRLVRDSGLDDEVVLAGLRERFAIEEVPGAHQRARTHQIGLYTGRAWYRLGPLPGSYDERNAVECIDADIVQRNFFDAVLGIAEPGDHRLNFVGGDRDLDFLQAGVDSGEYRYAVTLAPVTLGQFAAVCRQNRIMPPKSTWFQPKIRSGLVIALEEESAQPK